jgi:hypothetical protein
LIAIYQMYLFLLSGREGRMDENLVAICPDIASLVDVLLANGNLADQIKHVRERGLFFVSAKQLPSGVDFIYTSVIEDDYFTDFGIDKSWKFIDQEFWQVFNERSKHRTRMVRSLEHVYTSVYIIIDRETRQPILIASSPDVVPLINSILSRKRTRRWRMIIEQLESDTYDVIERVLSDGANLILYKTSDMRAPDLFFGVTRWNTVTEEFKQVFNHAIKRTRTRVSPGAISERIKQIESADEYLPDKPKVVAASLWFYHCSLPERRDKITEEELYTIAQNLFPISRDIFLDEHGFRLSPVIVKERICNLIKKYYDEPLVRETTPTTRSRRTSKLSKIVEKERKKRSKT